METRAAENPAIFMCKCCNLFSPSQAELLSHVSEKHAEEGVDVDDIIIPLRPLSTPEPTPPRKAGDELSVTKRKRGRPKGSTKKPSAEEEPVGSAAGPSEAPAPPRALEEGGSLAPGRLECPKCSRKFSNLRQLRKHICIIVLSLGEAEGDAGSESDLEPEKKCKEEDRERAPRRPRTQRTEKVQKASLGKEAAQGPGAKKPIVSVVLTAHEAIPGATKIIPVEAGPPETGATSPEATSTDLAPRRGYQEYAIQQTPYEQPMKSSRLGPTQLKIFTCEYCNKVFKFKHSLQAHLRIHTNEKPYACAHCSYASAIKANLNVHLRKHTGEKFACDCCAFTCLSKGHLKVHVERVHKKVKQHCRFCKKKYSDVKNLIKHVRAAHDAQDPQVRAALDGLRLLTREGKRQLLYDCHVCERKFKNELDRDRHMLVHGDQWPFACELCGHGATKYQALELHVRKHPFVYVCALCRRKFVSSIRLRAHIREAHAAAPEAAAFTSSINQSFCLLEPGGDLQPEAPPPEEAGEDAGPRAGRGEPEAQLRAPVPGPAGPAPQAGSAAPPPCELAAAGVSSGLPSPGAVSEEVVLESGTEAHPAPGRTLLPEPEGPAQSQGAEVTALLPADRSPAAAASQDTPGAESPPSHGPDPAEAADLPLVPSEEAEAPRPERRANMNAFLRILDGLAKRRMDPGLCERIRKVYGDLECEYCGQKELLLSGV